MASLARRALSSLNWLTTLILLFVLFILVNFISHRRYWRKDFSRQHLTSLSPQTLETTKNLKEPLHVTVFYQPTHRLYDLVKDLLKEYQRASAQIRVDYVDPQQDLAKANAIVKRFNLQAGDLDPNNPSLVIFESGSRHKFLNDNDLAEYDYESGEPMTGPRIKAFKGESAFTSAVINLAQKTQTLIWATTGHGEKELGAANPRGLSNLKRILEQQNFSILSVNLLEKNAIPAEVKLLIIPGPTHRFTESEVALLDKCLNGGGRLLFLVDPLNDTGLDVLLKQWGIVLGNDIVVDPERRLPFVSAANLFVTEYAADHPIVNKMKTLMTLFPLARSVSASKPPPAGVTVTPLAMTSAAGWGETQTSNERFEFNEGQDLKGPVSIAAAAERSQPVKARVVVIGDSDFAMNAQLDNAGNRDFALAALYWLTEQEQLIGISARPIESIKLSLTGGQLSGIFWFSIAGLPALMGLLGAGMWWMRRR